MSMHEVILSQDYKVVEDAWSEHGRRSYVHNGNADRQHITSLAQVFGHFGWVAARNQLRTFHHPVSGELIEIEPGGSETSGHFLHYISAAVANG